MPCALASGLPQSTDWQLLPDARPAPAQETGLTLVPAPTGERAMENRSWFRVPGARRDWGLHWRCINTLEKANAAGWVAPRTVTGCCPGVGLEQFHQLPVLTRSVREGWLEGARGRATTQEAVGQQRVHVRRFHCSRHGDAFGSRRVREPLDENTIRGRRVGDRQQCYETCLRQPAASGIKCLFPCMICLYVSWGNQGPNLGPSLCGLGKQQVTRTRKTGLECQQTSDVEARVLRRRRGSSQCRWPDCGLDTGFEPLIRSPHPVIWRNPHPSAPGRPSCSHLLM